MFILLKTLGLLRGRKKRADRKWMNKAEGHQGHTWTMSLGTTRHIWTRLKTTGDTSGRCGSEGGLRIWTGLVWTTSWFLWADELQTHKNTALPLAPPPAAARCFCTSAPVMKRRRSHEHTPPPAVWQKPHPWRPSCRSHGYQRQTRWQHKPRPSVPLATNRKL